MSIYLTNLNPAIDATINRGGITFRSGARIVDMICNKVKEGFELKFILSDNGTYTTIKAANSNEVAKKLAATVNDLFRAYTLKGMI